MGGYNFKEGVNGLFVKTITVLMVLSILIGSFMPILQMANVYAETTDKAKSTKESEEGNNISGSTRDNLNNVLASDSSVTDENAMKVLNDALSYDEKVQLLTTIKILKSNALKSNAKDYSSIYTGNTDEVDMETTTDLGKLFDVFNSNKADIDTNMKNAQIKSLKELEKSGKKDDVFKKLFKGTDIESKKGRDAVYTEIYNTLTKADNGVQGSNILKAKMLDSTATSLATGVCNTSYNGSTYGGLVRLDYNDNLTLGLLWKDGSLIVHTGSKDSDDNGELTGDSGKGKFNKSFYSEAKKGCITTLSKFYKGKTVKNDSGDKLNTPTVASTVDTIVESKKIDFKTNKSTLKSIINGVSDSRINSDMKGYYNGKFRDIDESGSKKFLDKLMLKDTGKNASGMVNMILDFRIGSNVRWGNEHINLYSTRLAKNSTGSNSTKAESMRESDIENAGKNYKEIFNSKVGGKVDDLLNDRGFQSYISTLNGVTTKKFNAVDKKGNAEKQFKTYFDSVRNSPYAVFKKNPEYFGVKGTSEVDGYKGLGFVPLYYTNFTESEGIRKSIKSFDSGKFTDKGIMVNSARRPVSIYDFASIKKGKKLSPYLAERDKGNGVAKNGVNGKEFKDLYKHTALKYSDGKVSERDGDSTDKINEKVSRFLFSDSKVTKNVEGKNSLAVDNYGNIVSVTDLSIVVPYWQNTEIYSKGNFYAHPYLRDAKPGIGGGSYDDGMKADAVEKAIKGNDGDAIKKIAEEIVKLTKEDVKKFNKEFKEGYNKDREQGVGELYLTSTSLDNDVSGSEDLNKKLDEFTDADLKQKIAMLLKYGAADFIRLTVVGLFVNFYNSVVYNFTMAEVFYTKTLVNTEFFNSTIPTIVMIITAVTMTYVIFSVIRMRRGLLTWGRFLTVFFLITFSIFLPYIYGFVIDKGINDVSDTMLGKQNRQMFVLDAQKHIIKDSLGLNKGAEVSDSDDEKVDKKDDSGVSNTPDADLQRLLGGGTGINLRDVSQDYTVEIYTTTRTDGCRLDKPVTDECVKKVGEGDWAVKKWDKSDLVSVKVSVFDIFDWLREEDKKAKVNAIEKDSKDSKTNKGKVTDGGTSLFDYLSQRKDAEDKGYKGLQDMSEYRIDRTVVLDSIGESQRERVYKGKSVTSSELLRAMYLNVDINDLESNIKLLDSVYDNYVSEKGTKKNITNEEREAIVRDLSMTSDARRFYYGSPTQLSGKSMMALSEGGTTFKGITVPKNGSGDFFSLKSTLEGLDPYRTPFKDSLSDDLFEVNKRVLDMYLTELAHVKKISGNAGGVYKESEKQVLILNLWFETNKQFDLNLYPRSFKGDTVSLDNYMRVAFVPIGEFANVLQNKNDAYTYQNVGMYISLRDNLFSLLLFSGAVIMLLIFGFVKWIVLGYVLLGLTIWAFFKNYIVTYNRDTKMWLGSAVVYGTFIVANLIFNGMWWFFGYYMNSQYAQNNNMVSYPVTALHSTAIMAVLGFIIFYVFRKIFDKVRKDIDNMGGQEFSDSIDKMKSKFGAIANNIKSKVNIGESYSKDVSKEGAEGHVSDDDLMSTQNYSDVQRRLSNAEGSGVRDEIMSYIDDEAAGLDENSLSGKLRGISNTKSRQYKSMKNIADKYDKIKPEEFNAEEYEGYGLEGSTLGKTGDGSSVYSLGFGTGEGAVRQAQSFSDYLTGKGISNVSDGNGNVAFDSGMHNLSTPAGRKALMDGFVMDSVNNARKQDMLKMDTVDNTAINNGLNYNVGKNGETELKISAKDGVHPDVLAKLLQSKNFKDNFRVIKQYTGKGKDGVMVIQNKNEGEEGFTLEDRELDIFKLFSADTRYRSVENLEAREQTNNDSILQFDEGNMTFNNLLNEELTKARKGKDKEEFVSMAKHSNKLVFDADNESQLELVERVRNRFLTETSSDSKDARDIATKVGSFVINGQGQKVNRKLRKDLREKVDMRSDDDNTALFDLNDSANYVNETDDKIGVEVETSQIISNVGAIVDNIKENVNTFKDDVFDVSRKVRVPSFKFNRVGSTVGEQLGLNDKVANNDVFNDDTMESDTPIGNGLKVRKLNSDNPHVKEFLVNNGFMDRKSIKTFNGVDFVENIEKVQPVLESVKENKVVVDNYFEHKTKAYDNAVKTLEGNTLDEYGKVEAVLNGLSKYKDEDSKSVYNKYVSKVMERVKRSEKLGTDVREDDEFETIFDNLNKEVENIDNYQSLMVDLGKNEFMNIKDKEEFNQQFVAAEEMLSTVGVDANIIKNLNSNEFANLMDVSDKGVSMKAQDDGTILIDMPQDVELNTVDVLNVVDKLIIK